MNPFAYVNYRFRLWRNDHDTRKFQDQCWHEEWIEVNE
jgi:hypothetical protein